MLCYFLSMLLEMSLSNAIFCLTIKKAYNIVVLELMHLFRGGGRYRVQTFE